MPRPERRRQDVLRGGHSGPEASPARVANSVGGHRALSAGILSDPAAFDVGTDEPYSSTVIGRVGMECQRDRTTRNDHQLRTKRLCDREACLSSGFHTPAHTTLSTVQRRLQRDHVGRDIGRHSCHRFQVVHIPRAKVSGALSHDKNHLDVGRLALVARSPTHGFLRMLQSRSPAAIEPAAGRKIGQYGAHQALRPDPDQAAPEGAPKLPPAGKYSNTF